MSHDPENDAFGQAVRNEVMALQKIIHEQQLMIARAYRAGWEACRAEQYDDRGWR